MSIVTHKISAADAQTMTAMRAQLASMPKIVFGPAGRATYDEIISRAVPADGVSFEPGEIGGVPGWWCRPAADDGAAAILYLHGGGYAVGSAAAYRNFVSQIVSRAGAAAFVADYALAPESPYPAALTDGAAVYKGLADAGFSRIAFCGDSAGAGLALSLLAGKAAALERVVGAVALSPWIDLSLSGASMETKADDDPLLSKSMMGDVAALFLGQYGPDEPALDVLDADLSSMPPVRIHVGKAEVLLDDSLRFADKAARARLDCEVHVWDGMIHVFPSSFGMLEASAEALDAIGLFLAEVLAPKR